MSPRHGPEELIEHFAPYEAEANRIGWEIPERPVMRSVFIAETKQKAEAIAAPALNYLFTELYGAASAAGEATGAAFAAPPRRERRERFFFSSVP